MENIFINEYLDAKEKLKYAQERILKVETELLKQCSLNKFEGTETFKTDTHKISFTKKVTRTIGRDYMDDDNAGLIPDDLKFVNYKPVIDLKRLREIDQAFVNKYIKMSPAKTQIKVEEI